MSQPQDNTTALHGGYRPENGQPRQIPIIQSTTFRYETSEAMGKLFNLEAAGYFYSRLQNPTNDHVAAKICALEGGTAAMLTASGQAAAFFAIFNLASAGDHVVTSSAVYGGTHNLFAVTMKRMGIEFTFISPNAPKEEIIAAFRPNTKALYAETLSNPSLHVLDIELFAEIAHQNGVPLVVDNTFPTPVHCKPIEWGADIVIHSTTKYLDGHATSIGGAIVDGGRFDWMANKDKFPDFCTPDPSYHGIVYAETFGNGGAFITKATVQLMRDLGATPSPMNSYFLNLGIETLPLRMEKHTKNALLVAQFLEAHPKVAWVNYPALPSNPELARCQKYLPNGSCGVLSFGMTDGIQAAEKLMEKLSLISIATHVADAKTCILHPASTTHRQLSEQELAQAGVPADLIRLSVGIEAAEDIISDLTQALG